jgi:hypothetical protein
MLSPNTVDQYSRFMNELYDEREIAIVDTVWQQFFGNPASGGSKTVYTEALDIDIDIIRMSGEKPAKMIHRNTDSHFLNMQKNVSDLNYSTFSRVFPLCEEISDMTASQINKRLPGENPYELMPQQARLRTLAQKHHAEHIRRYVRLFETLAGLSVLGGAHPAILGSTNADNWYDFRRNAGLLVSPTVKWDDPAADIIGDWDFAFDELRRLGHCIPDMTFAGANVLPVILNNATIQAMADNRGFQMVRAGDQNWTLPARYQRFVDAGATPIAWFMTPRGHRFYLFAYDGIVTDDNNVVVNLMPVNSFLFAYSGARCDRYFGPGEVLPVDPITAQLYQFYFGLNMMAPVIPAGVKNPNGTITPQMFHCDAVFDVSRKKISTRTQTAPIFATIQTDSFFTYYLCLTVES